MKITPSSRVCIESGKGRFLEDPTKTLAAALSLSLATTATPQAGGKNVDLYGVCTMTCFGRKGVGCGWDILLACVLA